MVMAPPGETDLLVDPQLVRRFDLHHQIAIERLVTRELCDAPLELDALDRRQLVFTAQRLARFGQQRRTFGRVLSWRAGDGQCGRLCG